MVKTPQRISDTVFENTIDELVNYGLLQKSKNEKEFWKTETHVHIEHEYYITEKGKSYLDENILANLNNNQQVINPPAKNIILWSSLKSFVAHPVWSKVIAAFIIWLVYSIIKHYYVSFAGLPID